MYGLMPGFLDPAPRFRGSIAVARVCNSSRMACVSGYVPRQLSVLLISFSMPRGTMLNAFVDGMVLFIWYDSKLNHSGNAVSFDFPRAESVSTRSAFNDRSMEQLTKPIQEWSGPQDRFSHREMRAFSLCVATARITAKTACKPVNSCCWISQNISGLVE